MEIQAAYVRGTRFEVTARGHKLLCDQPVENGGEDAGVSPPELLLASLATCAGYYAMQYMKTRSIAADGLQVKVVSEKALRPARLEAFHIEMIAPCLPEAHLEGLLRAVKACLIHNTLLNTPKIEVVVNTQEALVA